MSKYTVTGMWKVQLSKLQTIHNDVLQSRRYFDDSDAISLSKIDIDSIQRNSLIDLEENQSKFPVLFGLNKLASELDTLLTTCYGLQQNEILHLRNVIHSTSEGVKTYQQYLSNPKVVWQKSSHTNENLLDIEDYNVALNSTTDWTDLPKAEDELNNETDNSSATSPRPHQDVLTYENKRRFVA